VAKTSSKKQTDGAEKSPVTFEKALARLEEIVELLDDGNLPLAQSLALFREGAGLTKRCRSLLAEAEVQIKEALRDTETDDGPAEDEADGDEDEDDENAGAASSDE
jgi:exodeoxyribonuclease VII small subunit